jgi:hypothetical protein
MASLNRVLLIGSDRRWPFTWTLRSRPITQNRLCMVGERLKTTDSVTRLLFLLSYAASIVLATVAVEHFVFRLF